MQTHFKIMKWAVAKCPSVELNIMGESVPSLLDSGSMVSLMWQDHLNRYFRPQLGPSEGSVAGTTCLIWQVLVVGPYHYQGMSRWTWNI